MVERAKCMICQVSAEEGISILDSFLCVDCEQEIVQTEVEDSRYSMFVYKMKDLNLERYMF